MNVHWVIEKDVFDEEIPAIHAAVKEKGYTSQEVEYIPFDDKQTFNIDNDCPIVFYGSLNLGLRLKRTVDWIPGVYLNYKKFDCTYYYPRFGKELLNSEYFILPFGDIKRRIDQIQSDYFFIRPCSGLKTFTGKVIFKKNVKNELDNFQLYDKIEQEDLVLISFPKKIIEEYRFVVSGKNIISQSQYQPEQTNNVPSEVINYAQYVLNTIDYDPDPVWTLDIAKTNNELKVLEVGCFSCAGLYQCDMNDVVREVSRIAIEEYKDYQ